MTNRSNDSGAFDELRQKAEALLREQKVDTSSYPGDIIQLVHELQVYQTELEIQNEELKSSQQEISKQHCHEYETLYEFAPCGYITLSPDGIITLCNLKGVALLGMERGNLKAMALSAFVTQGSQNNYFKAFREARLSGEQQTTELELSKQDGETVWVQANIQSDWSEEGSIKQWLITLTDITPSKQSEEALRESEQRHRNVYENMRDAILLADTNRRIIDCNLAFESLFGYSLQEIKGKKTVYVYESESEFQKLGKALEEHYYDFSFLMTVNYKKKNGEVFPGETGAFYLKDNSGEIAGFIGVIRDVTDRKQMEEALRESERQLSTLMGNLPGMAYRCLNDRNWTMLFVSEGCYPLTGYRSSNLLQNRTVAYADLVHPDDVDMVWDAVQEELEMSGRFEIEYRIVTAEGEEKHVWEQGTSVYEGHSLVCLEGFITDITERKQAEEALRESEERFKTLLENLPGGIFAHDLDGRILMVNAQASKNTGYSREELLRMTVWDIDPYAATREDQNTLWQRLETGESTTIESIHIMKDGTQYPTEIHLNALTLDEQHIILPIAFDISWRKQFEQALRESEQQFRTLFIESPVSITIHDKDNGEIIDANPQAFASYGLSSVEEMNARGIFMEPPYSYTEALGWIRKAVTEGPQQFEWLNRNVYGVLFWQQVRLIPITINDVERVVATAIDITELKQTEEAFRKSEERYRKLINTSPDAIALVDVDEFGRFLTVNPTMAQRFGLTQGELEGKTYQEVMPKPLADKRIIDAKKSLNEEEIVCIEDERQDRYLQNYYVPIATSDNQRTFQIISRDITERKQMEEKLKEMSFRDSLTGLYNRNFFEEEMVRLGDGRYQPIGIVVCDLDGLKFVNDTLGHQAGDQMLIQSADILRQNFRSSDILARIGGDEFAILLTETNSEVVQQMLQRLRQEIEDYNNSYPEIPFSLSVGHALGEGELTDMQALFREADNRMYREKLQREGSARSAILHALTSSMEARDFDTEDHCDRLQELAASVARSLNLSQDFVNDLYLLTRFHDLGKVGIPDQILLKPGALTEEEWRQMRQHCEIGHRIASSVPDLEPIADFILKHHERWDGHGYPMGLSGEDIPLQCRILAIADAYDAMTSDRPYRKAMTREEAIAELRRCSGTQFDPELVEQFIQIL